MFAVVSCKKYSPRTVKVANFGDQDPEETLKRLKSMECMICGPCSHVEFNWDNYHHIESKHDTEELALAARDELLKDKARYRGF